MASTQVAMVSFKKLVVFFCNRTTSRIPKSIGWRVLVPIPDCLVIELGSTNNGPLVLVSKIPVVESYSLRRLHRH